MAASISAEIGTCDGSSERSGDGKNLVTALIRAVDVLRGQGRLQTITEKKQDLRKLYEREREISPVAEHTDLGDGDRSMTQAPGRLEGPLAPIRPSSEGPLSEKLLQRIRYERCQKV